CRPSTTGRSSKPASRDARSGWVLTLEGLAPARVRSGSASPTSTPPGRRSRNAVFASSKRNSKLAARSGSPSSRTRMATQGCSSSVSRSRSLSAAVFANQGSQPPVDVLGDALRIELLAGDPYAFLVQVELAALVPFEQVQEVGFDCFEA